MRLNSDEKNALTVWFGGILSDASISQYGVSKDIELEELDQQLVAKLKKIADNGDVYQLVSDLIIRDIVSRIDEKLPDGWTKISDLKNQPDTFTIAQNVVSKLSKLPKEHIILMRASKLLSKETSNITIDHPLTNRFGIISSNIAKKKYYLSNPHEPLSQYIWSHNDIESKNFADDHLYFYYRIKSAIFDKYQSQFVSEFLNEVRSFYGACLAHRVLFGYIEKPDIHPLVLCFDFKDGFIESVNNSDTDIQNATYFESVGRPAFFRKTERFLDSIRQVTAFFACNSPRLKTAAMWLLRAQMSNRNMDRVLEAAIALEVLLGDRAMADRMGLTKLMATRCAYAIGENQKERDELYKFFTEFYSLRSDIVHTGKINDTDREEVLTWESIELVRRLIVHEQNMELC